MVNFDTQESGHRPGRHRSRFLVQFFTIKPIKVMKTNDKTPSGETQKVDKRKNRGKCTPEQLEARRKRKAEREEWWRLSREGREAKQSYQSFMEQAEWMTHVKKEHFIQFLKNAIEAEETNIKLLKESFDQRLASHDKTKNWDTLKEAIAINNEWTDRLNPLFAARGVLQLFEQKEIFYKPGEGWWEREYAKVHRNFATYSRDN